MASRKQVCRYKLPVLKKVITRMRKKMRIIGPKGTVALKELLTVHGGVQEAEGSTATLRKRWSTVSKREHPPVSKMRLPDVIKYLYKTSSAPFDWDYSTLLTDGEKSRVGKRCREAPGVGEVATAPAGALPKRKRVRDDLDVPPALTSYQQHMSDTIKQLKSSDPDMTAKERFAEAVRRWNRDKKISADKAMRRRARQQRKAAGPQPASEPIEFQTAPRKKPQKAAPKRAPSRMVSGKLRPLTAAQKRQIEQYNPRRNKQRLKSAVRIHMQRGLSFEEARKRAENPLLGSRSAVGANFVDDMAQVGSGKPGVRVNTECPDHYEHKMPNGKYMCGKQHGSGKKKTG